MNPLIKDQEWIDRIALHQIDGLGPVFIRQLMDAVGSASSVFKCTAKDLQQLSFLTAAHRDAIKEQKTRKLAEKLFCQAQKESVRIFWFADTDYPLRFRGIADAPVLFYYKGVADLDIDKTIGIVGTRKPTHYGQQMVAQLIESCACAHPTIISGMAMGIDGLAHRRALDLGLPTIALVAHGLGHAYPAGHRHLKKRLESAGGVLTEHPWDSLVEKGFFPMRNRLIAALSDVLVVVETKSKGGSMITVNQALNYRRPVMAVPGRHIDPYSAGCNELIRDKQATMILDGNDLLSFMQWQGSTIPRAVQQQLFATLDESQMQIVQLLKEQPGKGLDQLLVQQSLNFSELSVALFELEHKGIIRTLPGNRYTLV